MSTQQEQSYTDPENTEITEQQVIDYLEQHPNFFQHHEKLLAGLNIPHECGGAVSLVEHQLRTLREQNQQMKHKLHELVEVARENDRLSERILRLTLSLMASSSLEDCLYAIEDILLNEFHADIINFKLFDNNGTVSAIKSDAALTPHQEELSLFSGFFKTARPLCGRIRKDQLDFLFGERADDIASTVLLPLGSQASLGMLAIGSHDPDHYHPGMGTMFLQQLSTLISTALANYLEDEEQAIP